GKGRSVVIPDLWRSKLPLAAARSAQELGLRSAIAAPLCVGKKRYGGPQHATDDAVAGYAGDLCVDTPASATLGHAEVPFFEGLSDCAALAVRAARTAELLQKRLAAESRRKELVHRGKTIARDAALGALAARAAESRPEPTVEGIVTRDPGMIDTLALLE